MNETTNLNSELLSADARGRKHIPFAVFAVIVVHIVLFLFLLVAAGCKAKARARRNALPSTEVVAQKPVSMPASPAAGTNAAPRVQQPVLTPAMIQAPVVATDPPAERRTAPAAVPVIQKAAQKAAPAQSQRPTAGTPAKTKFYVVRAGDTVEKIARMHRTSVEAIKAENKLKDHMLKPGQQLRVSTQKPKTSEEV